MTEENIRAVGLSVRQGTHRATGEVVRGAGALSRLPQAVRGLGGRKVFLLADKNTYVAAGERAYTLLTGAGIPCRVYLLPGERPVPDEGTAGAALMHYDPACDTVVAVGAGVIGDLAKILAHATRAKFLTVATAPSMDGYLSATSSVIRDGLKISLPTVSPAVVIGDTDVLVAAPGEALISGLGDMLAKYISLCEWRISHLVTGEYYCAAVAALVRSALASCVENADGLLARQPAAVEAVFDGLLSAGAAMNYAGMSRPASGTEHYMSHIWDMRTVSYGDPGSTHGIQCAIATLLVLRLYERLAGEVPDAARGIRYAEAFDREAWFSRLSDYLGKNADAMIALDRKEDKYAKDKQKAHITVLCERWEDVRRILREELPPAGEICALLRRIGAPVRPRDIGIDEGTLPLTFLATKDIRDKYILPRLLFDMGRLDEYAARLPELCDMTEFEK